MQFFSEIQKFLFFSVDLLSIFSFGLINIHKHFHHVGSCSGIRSISRLTAVIYEFQIGQLNLR